MGPAGRPSSTRVFSASSASVIRTQVANIVLDMGFVQSIGVAQARTSRRGPNHSMYETRHAQAFRPARSASSTIATTSARPCSGSTSTSGTPALASAVRLTASRPFASPCQCPPP